VSAPRRVFVVGCARSGTTLLQSLLAAHPEVASFPESHFFRQLTPGRRWARTLGLASRRARPRFLEFLADLGRPDLHGALPRLLPFARLYARGFVRTLDRLTSEQGKSVWVEKTPGHLWHIEDIERFVPGARFIHIVRSGPDVIASMYEVTHEHPETWSGSRDVEITGTHADDPNHAIVTYERLVAEPATALQELCGFVGLEYTDEMLAGYRAAAGSLVLQRESWKSSVQTSIRSANATKFFEVFRAEERDYILDRLSAVEETSAGR
jgi:sulfotransferase family protein